MWQIEIRCCKKRKLGYGVMGVWLWRTGIKLLQKGNQIVGNKEKSGPGKKWELSYQKMGIRLWTNGNQVVKNVNHEEMWRGYRLGDSPGQHQFYDQDSCPWKSQDLYEHDSYWDEQHGWRNSVKRKYRKYSRILCLHVIIYNWDMKNTIVSRLLV